MKELKDYLSGQIPGLTAFAVKVVLAVLAFWIGGKAIRWIVKMMRRSFKKANIDEGVAQFACSLCRILLFALLIFQIATAFGVTESSVAALLGTAGVTIGLGLQGGLANIAGGVMILLFKPFQVGDYIILDRQGSEGTVHKIEMCYTTLLSIDNKQVVLPNGTLSNSTIINVTAREKRRLEIKIQISYDSDIDTAKGILSRLLAEDPDVEVNEETLVFVDELTASGVLIGFRSWVATDRYFPAKWRLNQEIKEAFDASGIRITHTQLDVHIQS